MFGQPRIPSHIEIAKAKGRADLFQWSCRMCGAVGRQYPSWFSAKVPAEIHCKIHHSN